MTDWECVQCSARTRSGRQCERTTCKYSDMCWQHTKNTAGLSIKKSRIPRTGNGLFAEQSFRKNQIVTPYGGAIVDRDEYEATDGLYGVALTRDLVMDGRSTQSKLGRWANDCRQANKRAGHCRGNNAKLGAPYRRNNVWRLNVKATKNIPAGDEIYVSYGRQYWRGHGVPKKKAAAKRRR